MDLLNVLIAFAIIGVVIAIIVLVRCGMYLCSDKTYRLRAWVNDDVTQLEINAERTVRPSRNEGFVDKAKLAEKIVANRDYMNDYYTFRDRVPEMDAGTFARLLNVPTQYQYDVKYIQGLL
jgi:hypothetical protein